MTLALNSSTEARDPRSVMHVQLKPPQLWVRFADSSPTPFLLSHPISPQARAFLSQAAPQDAHSLILAPLSHSAS